MLSSVTLLFRVRNQITNKKTICPTMPTRFHLNHVFFFQSNPRNPRIRARLTLVTHRAYYDNSRDTFAQFYRLSHAGAVTHASASPARPPFYLLRYTSFFFSFSIRIAASGCFLRTQQIAAPERRKKKHRRGGFAAAVWCDVRDTIIRLVMARDPAGVCVWGLIKRGFDKLLDDHWVGKWRFKVRYFEET